MSNERSKPVRVLHLDPLNTGGISSLTVTINQLMERDRVIFDYLVFRDHKEFLEDKALACGGKKQIIDTENIHNTLRKVLWKEKEMVKLFKKERYDVVHVDASTPYDVVVALAARLAGVRTVVMHSHTDDYEPSGSFKETVKGWLMGLCRLLMLPTVTDYFAISEPAARFMFPRRVLKKHSYRIIRNGINVDNYRFDRSDRETYRKEAGLEGKYVLGHVGRFAAEKNHGFIINVFEKLREKNPNAVLLLVGEGELEQEIRDTAESKGLSDSVIFYGTTQNVRKPLLIMDGFIFPSRFEGLGIVAIEAQSAGLPVFCADTIVDEANLTDLFIRVHGWDADVWAEAICARTAAGQPRSGREQMIIDSGYDIKDTARELERFYLSALPPADK